LRVDADGTPLNVILTAANRNDTPQLICPQIGKRCTEHGSHFGMTRWVVERTFAWRHPFRRLRVRYERLAWMHQGFLRPGCAIICWRTLRKALREPFPFR
jgi:hypothetical protein